MNTIKVKLKNPKARLWNAAAADFVTGDGVFEVPDVPFWQRRVLDGSLVRVDGGDVPNAAPTKARMESTAEAPTKTEPLRTKGKNEDDDALFDATKAETDDTHGKSKKGGK